MASPKKADPKAAVRVSTSAETHSALSVPGPEAPVEPKDDSVFLKEVESFLAVVEKEEPDFKLEKLKSALRDLLPVEPGEAVSWGE